LLLVVVVVSHGSVVAHRHVSRTLWCLFALVVFVGVAYGLEASKIIVLKTSRFQNN